LTVNVQYEIHTRRTYLLAQRPAVVSAIASDKAKSNRPIAPAVASHLIEHEVAALLPEQRLAESNGLEIYLAEPGDIPAGLAEIGRLREIAFRAEGEGTGRDCDLDSFDTYYQHLFICRAMTGGFLAHIAWPVREMS